MCRTCKATNSEPVVRFACLDCSAATPSADAASTDWYNYDLTEDGILALRQGISRASTSARCLKVVRALFRRKSSA
jgi:hypothetical protein